MQKSPHQLTSEVMSIGVRITSADQQYLFSAFPELRFSPLKSPYLPTITVDSSQQYQQIEGFGFALTGGSALLISRLPDLERQALLQELFLPDGNGIGISFLRLSIGASDLSERSFSYADRPPGETDFELQHFDLFAGDPELIPLLQEILAVNHELKIIATAWSAPVWMKTHPSFVGGELRPDCYAVYAAYLVKYLLTMRSLGINIHAITPQNEPQNAKNDPSMTMSALTQADFIKHHLGPALTAAKLSEVEIFCWDHNCDAKEYPLTVFADVEARRYLAGSAWHLYAGDIAVLSEVHQLYPEMKLYFTEQWVGSDGQFAGDLLWHVQHVLLGALANWSQVVLEWNLAADPWCQPHTPGGEARCVGALTIGAEIQRNVAYYVIAHAAKFVRPGALRIASAANTSCQQVAFYHSSGLVTLIVLNSSSEAQTYAIEFQGQQAIASIPACAVATYVWQTSAM